MKKIEVRNSEILKNGDLRVSREPKQGIIFAICLAVGLGSLYGFVFNDNQDSVTINNVHPTFIVENPGEVSIRDEFFINGNDVIVPSTQEEPINVSLEEINSLNIIINNSSSVDDFINEVCEELDKDGIQFTCTSNSKNIDIDDAVVITLDQQYSAGPGTIIFAPLENGRMGNSDALTLAAERAFYEKGFLVDGVVCGQLGFREDEGGKISQRVPTDAEKVIGKDKNTSFVTISFGTQNTHARLTAASIEAMLTRYYSYINGDYGQEDLIYCAEEGEDYNDIANKLGTTSSKLDAYNNTTDETVLLTGKAIINPIAGELRQFNQHVPTNLYIDKTLWSK